MEKKKIGIVGGMGSRAGVFLLKRIIDHSPAETDQEFPEIIFHNNSMIPDRTRAIIYNERSPLSDILRSVDLFNRNNVELIGMGCITAHYYYEEIAAYTDAMVLNPLQTVSAHIQRTYPGAGRIGVLATTGTIRTGLFHKEMDKHDLKVVTLHSEQQENLFMKAVYMKSGFKSAVISEEARRLMKESVTRLMEQGVDVIVGGCTEVSVAMEFQHMEVPFIDALDLLAQRIVHCCYNPISIHI